MPVLLRLRAEREGGRGRGEEEGADACLTTGEEGRGA